MNHNNCKSLINRRSLLKGVGLGAATGALGLLGGDKSFAQMDSQPQKVQKFNANDDVKITKIESVRFNDKIDVGGGSGGEGNAEFYWVRLHTNTGIIGTGETYTIFQWRPRSIEDYARLLIGQDPRNI